MIYDKITLLNGSIVKNLTIVNGTEAERLASIAPQIGEAFYQTDGVIGNYVYNGTAWEVSALDASKQVLKIGSPQSHLGGALITQDNKMFVWGNQDSGELGIGTTTTSYQLPQEVHFPVDETGHVVQGLLISQASFALMSTGNLYSWGYGGAGALGHGDTANQSTPKKVATFNGTVSEIIYNKAISYSVNDWPIVVKLTNGEYWASGNNNQGQLGLGNTVQQNSFFQLVTPDPGSSPITNVWILGSTYGAMFIKTANNKLWAAGYNGYGQLGLGNTTSPNVFTEITFFTTNAIDIVDIHGACGYFDTALNTVSSFIYLDINGNVYSAGGNQFGQLGNGTIGGANQTTPVQVTLTKPVSEIHAFGGGAMTVYCKNTDGTFVRWGYNPYGQLGDGTFTDNGIPNQSTTQIDKIFTSEDANTYSYRSSVWLLQSDGILVGAGRNNVGQLGIGSTTDASTYTPILFNEPTNVTDIRAHGYADQFYSTLVTSDGKLYTCGYGGRNGLGIENVVLNQNTFRRVIL